ncbi:MAG: acetate--CoA ligase family protein [Candidatus Binataceae bacterium]|nr:acetate--CoA ligase family protein [Candidatus Binataceae bacterium]
MQTANLHPPGVRKLIAEARGLGRRALAENASKQILSRYGLAVPRSAVIRSVEEIEPALGSLNAPFVLKLISPDLVHKSEAGGVRTNLANGAAVRDAMKGMRDQAASRRLGIDGYLLEETAPSGQEVVIGGVIDASFGPLVMFGLGGIFVEILQDVSYRICPITVLDAKEMIHELRAAPVLSGARGRAPASETLLIVALMAIGGPGGLLLDLADEIAEVDINPLIVSSSAIVAVDARLILAEGPAHETR